MMYLLFPFITTNLLKFEIKDWKTEAALVWPAPFWVNYRYAWFRVFKDVDVYWQLVVHLQGFYSLILVAAMALSMSLSFVYLIFLHSISLVLQWRAEADALRTNEDQLTSFYFYFLYIYMWFFNILWNKILWICKIDSHF